MRHPLSKGRRPFRFAANEDSWTTDTAKAPWCGTGTSKRIVEEDSKRSFKTNGISQESADRGPWYFGITPAKTPRSRWSGEPVSLPNDSVDRRSSIAPPRIPKSDGKNGLAHLAEDLPPPHPTQQKRKGRSPDQRPTSDLCLLTSVKRARPARFERATYGFEVRRSIQLSYGRLCFVVIQTDEAEGFMPPTWIWFKLFLGFGYARCACTPETHSNRFVGVRSDGAEFGRKNG